MINRSNGIRHQITPLETETKQSVSFVCRELEVCVSGRSLAQSPTERGVSLRDQVQLPFYTYNQQIKEIRLRKREKIIMKALYNSNPEDVCL